MCTFCHKLRSTQNCLIQWFLSNLHKLSSTLRNDLSNLDQSLMENYRWHFLLTIEMLLLRDMFVKPENTKEKWLTTKSIENWNTRSYSQNDVHCKHSHLDKIINGCKNSNWTPETTYTVSLKDSRSIFIHNIVIRFRNNGCQQ